MLSSYHSLSAQIILFAIMVDKINSINNSRKSLQERLGLYLFQGLFSTFCIGKTICDILLFTF